MKLLEVETMSMKTEQKLNDLYQKLCQAGYHAELLGKDGKLLYTAFECSHRMIIFEYDEVSDLYGIGQLFDQNPLSQNSRPSLAFSEIFRSFHDNVIESYNSISGIFADCSDYIHNPVEYREVYNKWLHRNGLSAFQGIESL